MARTLPSHGNNVGSTPSSFAKYIYHTIIIMFKLDINTIYYSSVRLLKCHNLTEVLPSEITYPLTSNYRKLVSTDYEINKKSLVISIDTSRWADSYSFERISQYLKENRFPFRWMMLTKSEEENEITLVCFNDEQEFLDAIIKDIKTYREELAKKAAEEKAKQAEQKTNKDTLYDDPIKYTNSIIWEGHYASSNEPLSWRARIQSPRGTRISSLIQEADENNTQIQWTTAVNMPEQTVYYSEENPPQVVRVDTQVDRSTATVNYNTSWLGALLEQARQVMWDINIPI